MLVVSGGGNLDDLVPGQEAGAERIEYRGGDWETGQHGRRKQ